MTADQNGGCPSGDSGQPLWDQCQHGSYFFLPWHRMYLYYFERILRAAAGDPGLTLPYWNYESSIEQSMPAPFLQPALDCGGNPNAHPGCNPLFLTGRALNNGNPLPVGANDDSLAMTDTLFENFFGGSSPVDANGVAHKTCHFDNGYGALESQPHNVIHCDVGGKMCDPGTAAQDPIFWLHHAEIDHLWKVWLAQGGGRANPTNDAVWMTTPFSFYDETGTVVSLSAQDVLNTESQLGYRYDDDPTQPPSPPMPRIAERPPVFKPPQTLVVSSGVNIQLGSTRSDTKLKMTPAAASTMTRLLDDRSGPHAVDLTMKIANVKDSSGIQYEVYLNLPAGVSPERNSVYFVSNLGLFLHRGAAETTVRIDMTRTIQALRAKGVWTSSELSVSFVPRGSVGPDGRPVTIEPGARATIAAVSLTAR